MTLSSFQIALGFLCVVFGSAMLGLVIGRRLPAHHMTPETKSVVSVSMAVVGTMTALVIGFLISNASSSFKARNGAVAELSSDIIQLDATLRRYGPETEAARAGLQSYATLQLQDLFSSGTNRRPNVDDPASAALLEVVQDRILALKPADDRQRWLSAQALAQATGINQVRAQLVQQNVNTLPLPFVGAVLLWLVVVFASFGLFAPRNVTAFVALFFCALAVSSAVKLVLDLDTPFEGGIRLTPPPIHISSDPLRHAIGTINR